MNAKSPAQTAPPDIETLIIELRGHKVILDADLALIYGVPTKALIRPSSAMGTSSRLTSCSA